MTEWRMTCCDGRTYTLPAPVAWRLEYGLGSPCDSFWVKVLWSAGQEDKLADGTRIQVTEEGKTLFVGVIDECESQWTQAGCVAELTGRGLQALLLDNQAEAADYGQATLSEILRRYVTPYGIGLAKPVSLPAVWGFSVSSGSSCWKVVYEFARYYAGVTPRFTREGKLALHPWADGTPVVLGMEAPVTKAVWGAVSGDGEGCDRMEPADGSKWRFCKTRRPVQPGDPAAEKHRVPGQAVPG